MIPLHHSKPEGVVVVVFSPLFLNNSTLNDNKQTEQLAMDCYWSVRRIFPHCPAAKL